MRPIASRLPGDRLAWMGRMKDIWSTHIGRAVIVALLVTLAFAVVRVVGLRPAGALDIFSYWLLDETGLLDSLEDYSFVVSKIVGALLEIPMAVLAGVVVGLICRLSGCSVKTTGWVAGVVMAASHLPVKLLAMPVP